MPGTRSLRLLGAATLVGLLGLALLPQVALGAGFAGKASLTPRYQFVGDSAGTTYTLTVKNTGSVRTIGAVQITTPSSFWTITACPTAPSGWAKLLSASSCRYQSQTGGADDIQRGATKTFALTVATAAANANRSGTWSVVVSTKKDFTDPTWVKQAGPVTPGLKTTAYSFEVTDAVVASSAAAVGGPCPAANRQAPTGSTNNVVVICGINHTNMTQTPKQAYSTVGGTFVAGHGSFSSGPVAPGGSTVVLGNWSDVEVSNAPSTGLTLFAEVGAFPKRTSPRLDLADLSATNTAPVANGDDCETDEDTNCPGNVLVNDTDAEDDTLAVSEGSSNGTTWITPNGSGLVVVATDHGTVSINANGVDAGKYQYTPTNDYHGSDSFYYKITDGFAESASAKVSITVNAVNDDPVANGDGYATDEDTPLTIPAPGVLTNDSDIDGDSLHISALGTDAAHGGLTLNPDGSFSYNPVSDYNGPDSFTYVASDGTADSNLATVTITVNAVNDAPVADNDSFSMTENTTATITAGNGLLTDATDVDLDPLTFVLVTGPSQAATGGFTFNADGSFTYRPIANYTGGDSFTWKANDGTADSNVVTMSITVNSTGGGGGGGGCSGPVLAPDRIVPC